MAKAKKRTFRLERVPLLKIERGGGTQARTGNNEDTVVDYFERLKAGKELPPPVVFKDAEGKLWLADGFHRVEARARHGKSLGIEVELHHGDQRAAILYAASANAHHGLRRTPDDKRRAVGMLLADPEWREWSDRAIAEHCHVSHPFVAQVRASTGNVSSQRTGADGRKSETAAIGAANRERAVERQAASSANTLTHDSAPLPPARPRLTDEGAQDDAGDDVPVVRRDEGAEPEAPESQWEGYEPPFGGDLVEDGAMADSAQSDGPVDAAEVSVPASLEPIWALLAGAAEVDARLAAAARAWSAFQDEMLAHVRRVGTDAHLPSREHGTLDNDFGPSGCVHTMQAALRRMVPHVVCDACDGGGCGRCNGMGWFSRVGWKERCRVDGKLEAVGAGG